MSSPACCRRCAALPFLSQSKVGQRRRCSRCKGPVLVEHGTGQIFRIVEMQFHFDTKWKIAIPAAVAASLLLLVALARSSSAARKAASMDVCSAAQESALEPATGPMATHKNKAWARAASSKPAQRLAARPPAPLVTPTSAKPYSSRPIRASKTTDAGDGPDLHQKSAELRVAVAERKDGQETWGLHSEKELLAQLKKVQRLDIDAAFQKNLSQSGRVQPNVNEHVRQLKEHRPGLPYLEGEQCSTSAATANDLVNRSLVVRRGLFVFVQAQNPSEFQDEPVARAGDFVSCLVRTDGAREVTGSWQETDAVVPMQQILMAENAPVRGMLIGLLARVPGKTATESLARRALFDQDSRNRKAAIEALKERAAEDYSPVLLQGLHYPWPAVSHHAALSLAALHRIDAVPELVQFLEEPDPDLPYRDGGRIKIREMIRVNHHSNCLLCHPPSYGNNDVRGLVPSRSLPLPDGRVGRLYYGGNNGDTFVRGDVTYLRQDFSVMQDVEEARPWPTRQRFDFFVRTRDLTQGAGDRPLEPVWSGVVRIQEVRPAGAEGADGTRPRHHRGRMAREASPEMTTHCGRANK